MRLTVLGKSPSWQDAGGACSGYLIEEDGTAVLVDCGNGVFGKLRERIDYVDVDAVVLSTSTPTTSSTSFRTRTRSRTRRASSPCRSTAGPAPTTRRALCSRASRGRGETFRGVVGPGATRTDRNAFDLASTTRPSEIEIGHPHRFQPVPHFTRLRDEFRGDRPGDRLPRRFSPTRRSPSSLAELDLSWWRRRSPGRAHRHAPAPDCRGGRRPCARGGASAGRQVLVHISGSSSTPARAREAAAEAFGGPVQVRREGRHLRRL